jgi:hypothetical protein
MSIDFVSIAEESITDVHEASIVEGPTTDAPEDSIVEGSSTDAPEDSIVEGSTADAPEYSTASNHAAQIHPPASVWVHPAWGTLFDVIQPGRNVSALKRAVKKECKRALANYDPQELEVWGSPTELEKNPGGPCLHPAVPLEDGHHYWVEARKKHWVRRFVIPFIPVVGYAAIYDGVTYLGGTPETGVAAIFLGLLVKPIYEAAGDSVKAKIAKLFNRL